MVEIAKVKRVVYMGKNESKLANRRFERILNFIYKVRTKPIIPICRKCGSRI